MATAFSASALGITSIVVFLRLIGPCLCDPSCAPDGNCNKVNVALGKTADMSSRHTYKQSKRLSGPPSLAVDGNTARNTDNCVHTAGHRGQGLASSDWWLVDLGRNYTITNITVYHREGGEGSNTHSERIAGTWIYVDGVLCYKFPDSQGVTQKERDDVTCYQPTRGRVVRFAKDGVIDKDDHSYINFCEVQIWVCKPGRFGADCDKKCDPYCHPSDCDNYYGTCDNTTSTTAPSSTDDGNTTNCPAGDKGCTVTSKSAAGETNDIHTMGEMLGVGIGLFMAGIYLAVPKSL